MYPKELNYTKTHEWVKETEEFITVGITSFAVEELSDIVYVELRPEGEKVKKGSSLGTLESVKAVSDIYSPVSGEIREFNSKLQNQPELLNKDPYGEGWVIRLTPVERQELKGLMNAEEYEKFVEEEKGN
ncbi:MAG: glycine cleavage system protein GcvH [Deltaproteobacteria bacterium]|nr:glycine cleavage system protein GcvH [Deltaproteobacteria bacterium]MCD6295597.1 glycine cleavage system protein GcvH [Deltaproteobacteria bacterium]